MPLDHAAADDLPGGDAEQRRSEIVAQDELLLKSLGYGQELLRRMSGFSNFAISLSIICILAGCITSFPQGFCSVGPAAIGLGWPACCLLSLCVALAMAQLASAFPTAGGLYHWAAILGGRGWGWLTAWFNLAGLITVLAAINVGTYQFAIRVWDIKPEAWGPQGEMAAQWAGVLAITCAQALLNHLGIRITAALTDFSGTWILFVASALTVAMLASAPAIDLGRLVTFINYSGRSGGDVWPETGNLTWLFLLGFLLPAYTVTGFDASAHTAEETVGAAYHAPRGIVRSVLVSGLFGWVMLAAVVVAVPDMDRVAAAGKDAFHESIKQVLEPGRIWPLLSTGIVMAQFFCGLATVTSASRMAYAFARDGGLPYSEQMRHVSPKYRTPAMAIWTVSLLSVAFVVHAQTYSTIAAAGTMFLYISYVIPAALGLVAYGRTWTQMGPWNLGGPAYRTLAVLSILGCGLILVIGIRPPNEQNLWTVLIALGLTGLVWVAYERRHFRGPPQSVLKCSRVTGNEALQPAAAETN
jgi:amino acid transporter